AMQIQERAISFLRATAAAQGARVAHGPIRRTLCAAGASDVVHLRLLNELARDIATRADSDERQHDEPTHELLSFGARRVFQNRAAQLAEYSGTLLPSARIKNRSVEAFASRRPTSAPSFKLVVSTRISKFVGSPMQAVT